MELYPHQKLAVKQMFSGCILRGGVGSGKSLTALTYYYNEICDGSAFIDSSDPNYMVMGNPTDLYIITIPKKRDSLEWEKELMHFELYTNSSYNQNDVSVHIDSWNNIGKYCNVCGAFFIFDEQKVIGNGAWVKSFYQIAKKNKWVLLSATPGDNWMDYIPVFVANGFYKNRSEFIREHVIFSRFAKYPKVERYINTGKLLALRHRLTVDMSCVRETVRHEEIIDVGFNKKLYESVIDTRWDPYLSEPVRDASRLYFLLRRITNSSYERIEALKNLVYERRKVIIFYTYDYELEILRSAGYELGCYVAEWNGHKHMGIPTCDYWMYLCQYNSCAEAWECTTTDTIIFYSQNSSYKMTEQAMGRIDRINTPFKDLYYFKLVSKSGVDQRILKSLSQKEDFNEHAYICMLSRGNF